MSTFVILINFDNLKFNYFNELSIAVSRKISSATTVQTFPFLRNFEIFIKDICERVTVTRCFVLVQYDYVNFRDFLC